MNQNAPTGRLRDSEIAREKQYRLHERLGLLCGTGEPTPADLDRAQLEADLWESRLILTRIVNGQHPAPV